MTYQEMMNIAKAEGLEHEVDYSYGICLMAVGSDTPEAKSIAAQQALREWDVN